MRRLALVGIAAALPATAFAQQVPLRDLPKPVKEIEDPFSLVMGIAELKPGQVVVVDGMETTVTHVDFATGAKRVLGRKGNGPGEYNNPVGVIRLPGDTILVLDAPGGGGGAAIRAVKFLPNFNPGTTSNMMLMNTADTTIVQGTMFVDRAGKLYSTSVKLLMGPTGPTPADSMIIVRFDLEANPGFTRLGAIKTPQTGSQERRLEGSTIVVRVPFAGLALADAWTLLPDGTIAIIRGKGYTIEFLGRDGKTTPPVAIPYERIRVTEADKKAELDWQREQLNSVMAVIKKTMPPNLTLDLAITPPPSWPVEYPPIAAIIAWPAPNGNVWVRRSVPARLDREQWDVIDRSGKLVARWQLPPSTSLIGIGANAVYTSRRDEDDLRYLQRVVLPAR
jgi:hypothetical protein